MFTFQDIERIFEKIKRDIIETPLIRLVGLSQQTAANVYLKLENKQVGGSIKGRGAFTKVLMATEHERLVGFSTASSGNHGISLSIAAARNNIPLNLFLPENTPEYKIGKLKELGSTITLIGHSWDDANDEAYIYAQKFGIAYVHAFEDVDILKGHATAALEVTRQLPQIDVTICSMGGGGIISGFAQLIKTHNEAAQCYGVETLGAHSIFLSLSKGQPTKLNRMTSLAQSITVQSPTMRTFDAIRKNVEGVVLVSDFEAQIAQKETYHETGELIELAASCSVAAVKEGLIPDLKGKNVVILACGGNVDKKNLLDNIEQQTISERYYKI